MLKKIIISMTAIFLYSGCSNKTDISKKTLFPNQAMSAEYIDYENYKSDIDSLEITPNWSRDLERSVKDFNYYLDASFKSIDNHKSYLAKMYNADYYNFDEDGFNRKSIGNIEEKSNPTKLMKDSLKEISKKAIPTNEEESILNYSKTPIEVAGQESKKSLGKAEPNKQVAIQDKAKKSPKVNSSMTEYDSQLLNEYNF